MENKDKALVVIDYQKDFVDEKEGRLPIAGSSKNENAIMGMVSTALKEHWGNIVFTADTHPKWYYETLEGARLPVLHCPVDIDASENIIAIDAGAWFYGKLGDFILNMLKDVDFADQEKIKQFNFTYIDMILRRLFTKKVNQMEEASFIRVLTKNTFGCLTLEGAFNGTPKKIYVCGVVLNICVISNVVLLRAMFPNAEIVVVKNGCTGTSKEDEETVYKLLSSIQVDVVDSL